MSFLHLHTPKKVWISVATCSHVSGLIATAFHTSHMTLIKDQSTSHKGVKISPPQFIFALNRCQVHFCYKYQPSSGLSSSLLMKTSCLRLKLVELNFFARFNADDQRKTYISKYTFRSSRWTFSIDFTELIKPKWRYLGDIKGLLMIEQFHRLYQITAYNLLKARECYIKDQIHKQIPHPHLQLGDAVLVRDHTREQFRPCYKDYRITKR